jgi:hypothetical protein
MDSTRGDVGGHQGANRTVFEFLQRSGSDRLSLSSVKDANGDSLGSDLRCEFVGSVLRAGENDRPTFAGGDLRDD